MKSFGLLQNGNEALTQTIDNIMNGGILHALSQLFSQMTSSVLEGRRFVYGMTVWQETKDSAGRYPIIFKNCKDLDKINDWLFKNYQGYHFVIMLDQTHDEYEPFGKDTYVYFSNDALEEIKYYS